MRVPRMTGFPNITLGLTSIRSVTVMTPSPNDSCILALATALLKQTTIDGFRRLGSIAFNPAGEIERFASVGNYASYCRCVGSQEISNGKRKGRGNTKNGNRDPNLISKNLRRASAFQLLAGVAVVSNCWM